MRRTGNCEYCGWPLDLVDSEVEHVCDPEELLQRGAAVAFGLMGMAEAIRSHHPCVMGEHAWYMRPSLDDDVCERCGMTGKDFDAAVDARLAALDERGEGG